MKLKYYHFVSLLFSIYPITFLYSNNVQELLIAQILIPLIISFVATFAITASLYKLLNNINKATLISTIFVFAFYSYGYIFNTLTNINILTTMHRHVLPIFLFIIFYICYFINKLKGDALINIAKILSFTISVLIFINVFNIIPIEIKRNNLSVNQTQYSSNSIKESLNNENPDIYYIIMDEYASLSTIKEIWGHDNSDFTNYLESKGFYVTKDSRTRYHNSLWSLATSLNMSYIGRAISNEDFYKHFGSDKISSITGEKNVSLTDISSKLVDSNVTKYLRDKGYKIITYDNYYSIYPSKGLMKADVSYNYREGHSLSNLNELNILIIKTSILKPFSYAFEVSTASNNIYKNSTLYTLENIVNIPYKETSPKFVFAHILCPHSPFVFDKDGNEVDPANWKNWSNKEYYLEQYMYMTNRIKSVISDIMKYSNNPPIIIIQSDHGPRPYNSDKADENLEIPVEDMFKVFNAYYFPDGGYDALYDNIGPVNSFRVLFNKYFNEKFDILEDK